MIKNMDNQRICWWSALNKIDSLNCVHRQCGASQTINCFSWENANIIREQDETHFSNDTWNVTTWMWSQIDKNNAYKASCMCLDFFINLEIFRCCIGVRPLYLRGKILPVSVVYRDNDSLSRKVKFSGFLLFSCLTSSVLIITKDHTKSFFARS